MTKIHGLPDGQFNSGEDRDGYLTSRLGIKVPELHIGTSESETQVTATAAEINRVADDSARVVNTSSTALTVTAALHGQRIITLSSTSTAGSVQTLPAATGTGNTYTFIVATVNTNGHVIQVASTADTFEGIAYVNQDSANTVATFESAAASDTITLNGTTTGGAAVGDKVVVIDYATGKFQTDIHVTGTGTEATPFSAAV
jgi:hypothetical protein